MRIVYWPPLSKLLSGKLRFQLVVPDAVLSTSLADVNEEPFQYFAVACWRMLTFTLASPLVASDAVPQKPAGLQPVNVVIESPLYPDVKVVPDDVNSAFDVGAVIVSVGFVVSMVNVRAELVPVLVG